MTKDPKDMRSTYDAIASWYDKHRGRELSEKKYLKFILDRCVQGSNILDIGCGMGEPIASFLIANGYNVTGVDVSSNLLEYCNQRFPEHRWIKADMCQLNLDETFAAVLAWDSFFHLTHDEQRSMFQIFKTHLVPGGTLIFTSGPEHGEVWGNNGGEDLYHASLSQAEYRELLQNHGFEVLAHVVEDPECGKHTVWVSTLTLGT